MASQPVPVRNSGEWVRVLDELEDQLAGLRDCAPDEALQRELPATSWHPPAGIGDLPSALAPRATLLLEAMETLKPVLEQRRDEAARQLRAVTSVPREAGATSIYLDSVG